MNRLIPIAAALAAAAALLALAAPAAACPNWEAPPTFGQIDLFAGFTPDPYVRTITAGGTTDLARCAVGMAAAGYVTTAPDFDLYWNGASEQLTIAVQTAADAVLLVNGPSGEWYWRDDDRGTAPILTILNPQPGLYDIWVGTYDGSRRNPGQLIITELPY